MKMYEPVTELSFFKWYGDPEEVAFKQTMQ